MTVIEEIENKVQIESNQELITELKSSIQEYSDPNDIKEFFESNRDYLLEKFKNDNLFCETFLNLSNDESVKLLDNLTVPDKQDDMQNTHIFMIKQAYNDFSKYNNERKLNIPPSQFIDMIRAIYFCFTKDKQKNNNVEKINNFLSDLQVAFSKLEIINTTKGTSRFPEKLVSFFPLQMQLVAKLGNDISRYSEDKNEAIKESLKIFLAKTIDTVMLDYNKNIKMLTHTETAEFEDKMKNEIRDLAKQQFKHRHWGRRLLADILQIITGVIIFVAPVSCMRNQSPFFSRAKTNRQKFLESLLDTPIESTNETTPMLGK
ncbi:MAG: hypothetical protein LEGION0398_MBIBDBAK_00378 [Legionellaceae bacterium]